MALKWINEGDEEKALKNLYMPLGIRHPDVGQLRDSSGKHELHAAAEKGFARMVDALLNKFQDQLHVDDTDNSGHTALYLASIHGFPNIVDQLLVAGADPNIAKKDTKTALTIASYKGYLEIVKKLLAAGADVNKVPTGQYMGTALVLAVTSNHELVVDTLLAAGADVNLRSNEGYTPLWLAINQPNFKIAETLLAAGANPNIVTAGQETPLQLAFNKLFGRNGLYYQTNDYDILNNLMDAGADVNIRDTKWEGGTLLIKSIRLASHIFMFNMNLATKVLESGARVNDTAPDGQTALHLVCKSSYESVSRILTLLLEKGADVNAKDKNGLTPLHVVAEFGSALVLEKLLEKRPDINAQTKTIKETPLFMACTHNNIEIVRTLLAAGANPNIPDKDGDTPLLWLSENTESLDDVGDNNNDENDEQWAIIETSVDIVKLLVASGADKTLRNKDGLLPFQIARNPEILKLVKIDQQSNTAPLKWQGWTRGDASMLDGIFGDEETAKNFALCPVCMKYVVRSEACMYMSHNCSKAKGYFHKELYKKYKNIEGVVNWCTICGRICKGHNHYKLTLAQGAVPAIIHGKDPFARSCEGEGGGGVIEKLLRFRRLREYARELQSEVGKMGWWEAMDELCEEMWNAPTARARSVVKTMLEGKKYNIPNTNFPLLLPQVENAPNIPNTAEAPIIHETETEEYKNALYIDDTNIIQFRHRKTNGEWNRHEGPGQQISREGFLGWVKSMLENPTGEEFGKCWQYKTVRQQAALREADRELVCDAILHPDEVKAALDLGEAEQARLAEGYRKAFNATMDTRKMYRP